MSNEKDDVTSEELPTEEVEEPMEPEEPPPQEEDAEIKVILKPPMTPPEGVPPPLADGWTMVYCPEVKDSMRFIQVVHNMHTD
jgi:hypothetical protein